MWFGYAIIIALTVILLMLTFSLCGARIREHPVRLFSLGFFVAGAGALIWASAEVFSETTNFLCPRVSSSEHCVLTSNLGVMTRKLVEVGFAALGAGLMALAIDLKSKAALDTTHRGFESKAKQVQRKMFLWRRAFDKLGEELDSITPQERIQRYRQLQDNWWRIQDKEDDLREEFKRWRLEYTEVIEEAGVSVRPSDYETHP